MVVCLVNATLFALAWCAICWCHLQLSHQCASLSSLTPPHTFATSFPLHSPFPPQHNKSTQGEPSCVAQAVYVVTAAVDRYKELCEGKYSGECERKSERGGGKKSEGWFEGGSRIPEGYLHLPDSICPP